MNLREQAGADLVGILEDQSAGFGWPITVTPPTGSAVPMTGFSTDIGQSIDPETGMTVAGRLASVALSTRSLAAASLGIPRGIASSSSKPWLVTFADIGGASYTYKVTEAMPDRAIGCVTCILEAYK